MENLNSKISGKKITLPAIAILILISLIGCSTRYSLEKFPSKEKYYNAFNEYTKNKKLEVVTKKDSIIIAKYGADIIGDSIYINFPQDIEDNKTMLLKQVNNIDYTNHYINNLSAHITLNSGQVYEARSIKLTKDSICFSGTTRINKKYSLSMEIIKSISFTENKKGIPTGIYAGVITGAAASYLILLKPASNSSNNSSDQNWGSDTSAIIVGGLIGGVIGGFLGWLIGADTIFYF